MNTERSHPSVTLCVFTEAGAFESSEAVLALSGR
jgi:hypothetical protein